MKLYKIILLGILTLGSGTTYGQKIDRFNTFSYSVNEGLLQSTINDIAFDAQNFCWISFPNGIQKFDGKNFTGIPVQPGLPDDKFVNFFRCQNGSLLLSHSYGISKYDIDRNRFVLVYGNAAEERRPASFIGEDGGSVYFYEFNGNITAINRDNYKQTASAKTGLPHHMAGTDYRPSFSSNIINHKVALQLRSCLYLWNLQTGKMIARSDSVEALSMFFLSMKSETAVYYNTYTANNALFTYDFYSKKHSKQLVAGKDDAYISRCNIYPWYGKKLISFNNHLYVTDSAVQELRSEIVNFQNKPSVSPNTGIAHIFTDNFGNLYLQTVTEGIRKIIRNNYPIKYYGTEKREENNVLSILPDKKNNRVLVGTANNGVLVFDTLQHLVAHIKNLPGRTEPFSTNNIIKDNKGNYLLFNNGEKIVWCVSSDLTKINAVAIHLLNTDIGISYFGNFLFQDENKAVVQSQGLLYRTDFNTGKVYGQEFTSAYTMGGLWYKSSIISHANDELIFLNAASFAPVKKIPFKNTGYVRCFLSDDAGNIYIGCNKGIFKIDSAGNVLMHLTKKNGLPDECIYAMAFDKKGFLWCSTNKGIFKLEDDKNILLLTRDDGLQENEFNTNVVAKAEDGEMFFGGVNGVSSFYPEAISNFEEKINLLVTQVKINNEAIFRDTAVSAIDRIELSYDRNSISVDFIAMANNNPGQYTYQYMMEGIDKAWIQNEGLQTVRYFLPPGTYTLKLYASRFFDKAAKPMKEIVFIIHPPFWKSWWFITGLILLGVILLAYAFNRYNKNKYQRKLAILESEHKIQLERERISRDLHDSIGAYANAVLYNTELLQSGEDVREKNMLMNDLKFASRDIITSLRETVWALKQDNYTAEECFLRIKNFIHSVARYYPGIQFRVTGEATAEIRLHHSQALHVVRIVQEAITNAVKHAGAATISVISTIRDGQWKLTVVDDGTGFDPLNMPGSGNGLQHMKNRAKEAGIIFTVDSAANHGTSLGIII